MEIASRASYRGQVTKLVKSAVEYLKSDDSKINDNVDNLDDIEEEIEVLLDRLTSAHECLKRANAEVIAFLKPEDIVKEAENSADYEDKAIGTITRLKHRLAKVRLQLGRAKAEKSSPENMPQNASSQPLAWSHSSHSAVNLQKLQPRKFSGDFKEWIPFWEQYRVLIHENPSISMVDKFNYLETVLTGKATETLVGLTPTEANYNVAISLLKEEYGNTEKIVDHTMQGLLSIQPVSARSDVSGLRRLYNSVLASTRSLTALGIPTSNYFVMLKGVLLRCLPNELRVDFHRYYDDSEGNGNICTDQPNEANNSSVSNHSESISSGDKQVNCLLRFLKREVESLEKANEARSVITRTKVQNVSRPVKTAYGLFTAETKDGCLFCKSANHDAKECGSSKSLADKKQILKKEGRCFRCFKKGHNSKTCKVKGIICKTCGGRHSTSMCDPLFAESKRASTSSIINKNEMSRSSFSHPSTTQPSLNLCTTESRQRGNVYLQTACAFVSSECGSLPLYVRVVLDGGSQLSFIKSSLVKRLNLPTIGVHNLSVIPFGSTKPRPSKFCNKVRVVLRSQYDDRAVVFDAIEVPEICFDVLSVPGAHIASEVPKLMLADARISGHHLEEGISILIGADAYWQFATGEIKRITASLTAINTILGWTIQGPAETQSSGSGLSCATSLHVCVCEDVERFWKLDVLGISSEESKEVSKDLSCNIRRNGSRYEVTLPWKSTIVHLDDNRMGALARMQSLVRKLCKAGKIEEYSAAINEMISTGIAEPVPGKITSERRTFYLPHRPVYREDKETTKLRIVFDASAHAPNYSSLNDCLEVGCNLLPELLVVLLNFRTGSIGIVADIEKAFHQILLNEKDRDSHRFLWLGDSVENERVQSKVKVFRMTRVTFGVTSSPFLLAVTLRKIIDDAMGQYKETCEKLRTSFYVDDFITSVDDENSAKRIYREATTILSDASMTLRKWNSNRESVRRCFAVEDQSPRTQKVLGLRWVVLTDELEVDLEPLVKLLKSGLVRSTKRDVLKFMAKIFDPFGILCPWTVRLKILFQNIWRRKLDWDEELPDDLNLVWLACCNEISELTEIAIPRHLLIGRSSIEFHVFADASQYAFGAVAYAKTIDNDGNTSVHFICAKNRVAPLRIDFQNELTIPKLELTAALVASRLLVYLRKNLQINCNTAYLWTDSQIALFWIQGVNKRWKPYIESRVAEIRRLSDVSSWRHCPGAINPADFLTRGISAKSLVNSSLWFNGLSWMHEEINWPISAEVHTSICALCALVADELVAWSSNFTSPILNCEDFSTWRRLLRVTAYVFRAIDVLKHKRTFPKYLIAEEIMRAENYWLHVVQHLHFHQEIASFRNTKGIPSNSKLIMLSPFLDDNDGFLRVSGRLQFAVDNVNEAHPIILPKSSHITKLIVTDAHEKAFHAGASSVLSRLRSSYWIIKGRQLLRTVIQKCFVCKVLRGKAANQPFAPLPKDRILGSRPFDVTGIDFAGPLYVAEPVHQRKQKMYFLLFTCAAVRGVHIESTMDLTTESCLLAIRRFIARRGVPRIIYSDNATTFKRAASDLRKLDEVTTSERFLGFLCERRIKWKFIVERAPWWGGFWERLIGVVKAALRAAVGKSTLSIDQLQTLLVEVEGVINSRPLTYLGDDPLDLAPLTPAHFLGTNNEISNEPTAETLSGKDLRKQWKDRLRCLATFKRRWFREYLQQLRSLHQVKNSLKSCLQVGRVVLLEDPSLPRRLWHIAVIQKVFPGRDGKIRACEIRLGNGSVLRRPIQLLYPLEITEST